MSTIIFDFSKLEETVMYSTFQELIKLNRVRPIDVSRATGISSSTFSDWKSGKSTPNADKLVKIARYLNTTVEYLVTGEDSQPAAPSSFLSKDEWEVLDLFRRVDNGTKQSVLILLRNAPKEKGVSGLQA